MIIASYGSIPPTGAVAKVLSNFKPHKLLPGVSNDVKKIQKLIDNDSQKQIATVSPILSCEEISVAACKRDIKHEMDIIKLKHHDTSNGLLIWYTGHGNKDSGDWPLKDGGLLTFRDIYYLYKKHFKGRPLYIVSDCCYSGAWVQDCAKLFDGDGIKCGHQARDDGMYLKVFSSCLPNETAYDKYYVELKGARQHRCTKTICFAEHQRIGKDTIHCQHTLGVDFTSGDSGSLKLCIKDVNNECVHLSTWTKYVHELIEQQPSQHYLV